MQSASQELFARYFAAVRMQRPGQPYDPRRPAFKQSDMARVFGVHQSQVSSWRTGRLRIPVAVLKDMCAEIGCGMAPWLVALEAQRATDADTLAAWRDVLALVGGLPAVVVPDAERLDSVEAALEVSRAATGIGLGSDAIADDEIRRLSADRADERRPRDGETPDAYQTRIAAAAERHEVEDAEIRQAVMDTAPAARANALAELRAASREAGDNSAILPDDGLSGTPTGV